MSAWDWPDRSPASLCPSPGQRARDALIANHYRSDNAIAEAAQCSHATVGHVRHLLEEDGTIGLLEWQDRQHRTRVPCADPLPFIPAIPPQPPELARGLCVSHPRPQIWQASRNPTLRAEAIAICRQCPVLASCREWALSLPPFTGRQIGILAALTVADRDRLRRERRQQAAQDRTARKAARPRKPRKPARPARKAPRP